MKNEYNNIQFLSILKKEFNYIITLLYNILNNKNNILKLSSILKL